MGSALGLHGNQIGAPAVTPAQRHPGLRSNGVCSLVVSVSSPGHPTSPGLMQGWIQTDKTITLSGQRAEGASSTHLSTSAWQLAPCAWTRGRPVWCCGSRAHLSSEPHPMAYVGSLCVPHGEKPPSGFPAPSC